MVLTADTDVFSVVTTMDVDEVVCVERVEVLVVSSGWRFKIIDPGPVMATVVGFADA